MTLAVRPKKSGPQIDAYPGDTDSLHGMLVRYFEESETASADERQMAELCRDYYDSRQLSPEEMRVLRQRHQPVTINNYIKRKIELLRGLERRGRSDPKAFPRTPTEDNRADAATQALRYVADDQRYDVVRSSVFDNILVEGMGGCEVIVERDKADGGYNIVINHVTWDRLFRDPHSYHPGFTDARYLGVVIWMDRDEAVDKYPDREDILTASFDSSTDGGFGGFGAGVGQTYDDKPRHIWVDGRRRRLRVVQIWWKRKDDWWTATYTKGGFLDDPLKSPYKDRHGNAACPLILRSAYCDRDLQRYGVVRDMLSLQDSINKRESKLMHSLSVNQLILEEGAVDDVDKARREAAKPDGVIVRNKGFEFEVHKDQAEVEGHFKLLEYAVAQMNVTGPNAAMSGKDPREQSGRAIIAQQSGGQMEHEPIADALRQHTHKVFEATWARIKQFWTDEKWIRVTDSDKNVSFVGLNHPVTIADLLGNLDQTQPLAPQIHGLQPKDQQAVMIGLRLPPNDPRLQTVVRIENDVNDMDVSITVEEGPDNPTMQAEQFQMLMQLPMEILQQFPPDVIIKASSLRNKDELLKALEEHQQAQAGAQQAEQQAKEALVKGKIDNLTASATDKRAQAAERIHGMAKDHANHPLDQVERLHGMAVDHATTTNALMPQEPEQPPQPEGPPQPPPPDPMAMQQQQHGQDMDAAGLALKANQQQHQQRMDLANHALAVKQANKPQPSARA